MDFNNGLMIEYMWITTVGSATGRTITIPKAYTTKYEIVRNMRHYTTAKGEASARGVSCKPLNLSQFQYCDVAADDVFIMIGY